MQRSLYLLAAEAGAGKSALACGLVSVLSRRFTTIGLFRPITGGGRDAVIDQLLALTGGTQSYESTRGVSYAELKADPDQALATVIGRYQELTAYDIVVILGSDYSDIVDATEFQHNATIAANLNAPVILTLPSHQLAPAPLRHLVNDLVTVLRQAHATTLGLVATRLPPAELTAYATALDSLALPLVHLVPAVDSVESARANPAASDPGATAQWQRWASVAAQVMARYVDLDRLLGALDANQPAITTPARFQADLYARARANRRTIVLPEADDDRILKAAAIVAAQGLANLIVLGDEATIAGRAGQLGLDLTGVMAVDPADPRLAEQFALEYARLRAAKGVTIEQARDKMKDLSYFATMMIHAGLADGMVSGANHTTANTIRPALEFIKTKPGVDTVSGAFLMCLADRVLVFADCAVTPSPTAEQLAAIALASADTAQAFGIEPRVALLSYSTGQSGSGPAVDLVAAALAIVRQRAPELAVDGPLQFDAAIDPVTAQTKLPGSAVAGRATVFVFPDLNSGNIAYKAVQRTANALAVGPVLQGLRRPVNDLSRGALVEDIVNTVAVTAIQAQSA